MAAKYMVQIRQFIAKLQNFITDRRSAPRYKFRVPVTIYLASEKNFGAKLLQTQKVPWTSGMTKDLSEGGIAFYVSSIRLHENYLVGDGRALTAKLELPEGEVTMTIVGVRYEREAGNFIELKYLIGARILNVNQTDREIYQRFLQNKDKREKVDIQDLSAEKSAS